MKGVKLSLGCLAVANTGVVPSFLFSLFSSTPEKKNFRGHSLNRLAISCVDAVPYLLQIIYISLPPSFF